MPSAILLLLQKQHRSNQRSDPDSNAKMEASSVEEDEVPFSPPTSAPGPKNLKEAYEQSSVNAKNAFNSIHLRKEEFVDKKEGNENEIVQNISEDDEKDHADDNEDDDVDAPISSREFNATMQVANHLIAEIHDYKFHVMEDGDSDDNSSSGGVEENVLKSVAYGEVCLHTMLQLVGGPDGKNLSNLTINQLLDLIVWIEFFRKVLLEANPEIKKIGFTLQRIYLHEKPHFTFPQEQQISQHELQEISNDGDVNEDKRNISTEAFNTELIALLAWIHNMSWEVHRLAQDEFLLRTRRTTDKWLNQIYSKHYEVWQTKEGRLITNLCEDVFAMVSLQMKTMQERLTDSAPDALVIGVCITFSRLREKQVQSRNLFLNDFETCIAAANNFQRMSDMVDDVCSRHLISLPKASEDLLEGCRTDLMSTFTQDAVYSAQKASVFIFEPIRESIFMQIFSANWLNNMTKNEYTLRLTRTLQDFIDDLVTFLDDYLMKKLLIALVKATINFYVERLVNAAETHPRGRLKFTKAYFSDVPQATKRFEDDIQILVNFFNSLSTIVPGMPTEYAKDLNLLAVVNELMSIAGSSSSVSSYTHSNNANVDDYIIVIHKSVRDISVTRSLVGDIWLLTQPMERKKIKQHVINQRNLLERAYICENDLREVNSIEEYGGARERLVDLELGMVLKEEYTRRKKQRREKHLKRLRGDFSRGDKIPRWRRNQQVHPYVVEQEQQ